MKIGMAGLFWAACTLPDCMYKEGSLPSWAESRAEVLHNCGNKAEWNGGEGKRKCLVLMGVGSV